MDILEPTSHTVGAGPLFRAMADEIQLVTLISGMVRWDARQSAVSPGERILVLILDVLAGKTPLYRLWERLTTTDLEILVGAGRRPEDFTDDSLGRALDKLARAEPAKVFSTIAAYAAEGLTLGTGHWDSTSRSVFGDFEHAGDATALPAYGHSKDHRPDLKQILMTLFVNREGVPLFGTVASGNQSDKTLNGDMIDRLTPGPGPPPTAAAHLCRGFRLGDRRVGGDWSRGAAGPRGRILGIGTSRHHRRFALSPGGVSLPDPRPTARPYPGSRHRSPATPLGTGRGVPGRAILCLRSRCPAGAGSLARDDGPALAPRDWRSPHRNAVRAPRAPPERTRNRGCHHHLAGGNHHRRRGRRTAATGVGTPQHLCLDHHGVGR